MTYSAQEMATLIAKGMRTHKFDPAAYGMSVETHEKRGMLSKLKLDLPRPNENPTTYYIDRENDYDVKVAVGLVASWARGVRYEERRKSASDFFAGRTGEPYMGDVVVGRLLRHHGSSWEDFVRRIVAMYERMPGGVDNRTALSTYSGTTVPAAFARRYYKRTYGFDRTGLPEMHLELFKPEKDMAIEIEVGPGCVWSSYGKGQVWIDGQYPSSYYQSMKGLRVMEVVAHPAFDMDELIIKSARYDGRRTVLEVAQITEEIPRPIRKALDKAA